MWGQYPCPTYTPGRRYHTLSWKIVIISHKPQQGYLWGIILWIEHQPDILILVKKSSSLNLAHTPAVLSSAMPLCSCLLLNGLDPIMCLLNVINVQDASVACKVRKFGGTVYRLPGEEEKRKAHKTRREEKIIHLRKVGESYQMYSLRPGCYWREDLKLFKVRVLSSFGDHKLWDLGRMVCSPAYFSLC